MLVRFCAPVHFSAAILRFRQHKGAWFSDRRAEKSAQTHANQHNRGRSLHADFSVTRLSIGSKRAFRSRPFELDENSLVRRSTSTLSLLHVLVVGLDSSAREPIKSPPPTTQAQIVRARDLGVPFEGTPGRLNSITDVPGVEVGYTTLINGEGKLEVGKGPVRTGVTAIQPRGHASLNDPVYAGFFSFNGNGEMTGTVWVEDGGFLEGPIIITNTHSIGVARDAAIAWRVKQGAADKTGYWWSTPVVAETWDGWLNDINGFHVKPDDVWHALDTAHGGAIEEGSVGGGTGMICYEFKGGNGTASRVVSVAVAGDGDPGSQKASRAYTVGVFLQANFGRRPQLMIAGIPVGKEIPGEVYKQESGSCIAVVATDAPLLPNQLKRLARRVSLGLARTGTVSGNTSGDLFIAFSIANPNVVSPDQITHDVQTIPNDLMDPLFAGVVQATEEAVVNALIDNRSMTGRDNHRVDALPHDRLREIMKRVR